MRDFHRLLTPRLFWDVPERGEVPKNDPVAGKTKKAVGNRLFLFQIRLEDFYSSFDGYFLSTILKMTRLSPPKKMIIEE